MHGLLIRPLIQSINFVLFSFDSLYFLLFGCLILIKLKLNLYMNIVPLQAPVITMLQKTGLITTQTAGTRPSITPTASRPPSTRAWRTISWRRSLTRAASPGTCPSKTCRSTDPVAAPVQHPRPQPWLRRWAWSARRRPAYPPWSPPAPGT